MKNAKAEKFIQLGLAHIEKAVLAGVGLFLMYVLIYEPFGSAKWSAFTTHPQEFQDKIDSAKTAHGAAQWGASDEKKKFEELFDVRVAVGAQKNQLDVSRFEYETPYHFSPHEKKQKDRMPAMLPVLELLADASQAIMRPTPTDEDPDEPAVAAGRDGKLAGRIVGQQGAPQVGRPMSTVAPRRKRQTGGGGGAGFGAAGGSPMGGGVGVGPSSAQAGGGGGAPGAGPPPGNPMGAQIGGLNGSGGGGGLAGGFNGGGGSVYNAKQRVGTPLGYNFVSIRGLVMLRDQAEAFRKALNLDTLSEAMERLEIVDFELERQTAVAGSNAWGGPWQKINLMAARDIVMSVEWEADVVSSDLTDQVVSMPLPRREAGEWDWFGTHPRLGLLAAEARERQVLENEQALKESQKEAANRKQRRAKGGFAAFQHDIRGIRGRVMQGKKGNEISKNATKQMGQEGYQGFTGQLGGGASGKSGGADQFQAKLAGKVLLFRYLDFDVIPGNAYRYRVRLVLRNPNYEKPPTMLHETAVASADQETISTPWSAPSGVWNVRRQAVVPGSALVRESVRYYLTSVRSGRRSTPGMADFSVYQWFPSAGTDVSGRIKAQFGQFISQGIQTLVLRPAEESFGEEEVTLRTGDVLLDIQSPDSLDESDHPDLPIGALKNRRGIQVASAGALVVNKYGQLVSHGRSPLEVQREQSEKQQLDYDRRPWQDLLNKKKSGAESNQGFQFNAGSQNPMGGNGSEGGKSKKRGRRKKNPIRRDNAYGGGGGGMSGMGGMPGMGGGMGGGMPGMGGAMPGMGGAMPGMGGGPMGGAGGGFPGGGPMGGGAGGGFPGGGPMGGGAGGGFPGGGPMGGGGGFPGGQPR